VRARESAATCSNHGEKKDKKRRCWEIPTVSDQSIDHSFLPHVIYVGRIRGASRRQSESNRMQEASLYLSYTNCLCVAKRVSGDEREKLGCSQSSFELSRDCSFEHGFAETISYIVEDCSPFVAGVHDATRDSDQFPPRMQKSRSMNVQSCVNVQRELAINRRPASKCCKDIRQHVAYLRTHTKHAYACIETYRYTYIYNMI